MKNYTHNQIPILLKKHLHQIIIYPGQMVFPQCSSLGKESSASLAFPTTAPGWSMRFYHNCHNFFTLVNNFPVCITTISIYVVNNHHHGLDKVVNLCKANNWMKPTVYQVMKLIIWTQQWWQRWWSNAISSKQKHCLIAYSGHVQRYNASSWTRADPMPPLS